MANISPLAKATVKQKSSPLFPERKSHLTAKTQKRKTAKQSFAVYQNMCQIFQFPKLQIKHKIFFKRHKFSETWPWSSCIVKLIRIHRENKNTMFSRRRLLGQDGPEGKVSNKSDTRIHLKTETGCGQLPVFFQSCSGHFRVARINSEFDELGTNNIQCSV